MARFRLTPRAEADLLEIAEYTLRTWGEDQCARYIGQLEQCCQRLADQTLLGRQCDAIRPGMRRHDQGKHVIFHRRTGDGVVVVRILHRQMLAELHLDED